MKARSSQDYAGYALLCTNEKGKSFYQRFVNGYVLVWDTLLDANTAKDAFLKGRQMRGRQIISIEIGLVEKGFRQGE